MPDGFRIADAYVEIHARGQDRVGREVRDAVRSDGNFDAAGSEAGARFGGSFSRDATSRVRAERGSFGAEGRGAGGEFGRGFGDGVNESGLGSRIGSLGAELGGHLTRGLLGPLGSLGSALTKTMGLATLAGGIAAVGGAAASSAGYLTALVAELMPVNGLLAALPGLLMTGVAALTTWKLATYGVGSAMAAVWAGDGKALEEALAKLTPAATAFVEEFQKTLPALKGFQAAAQTGFFSELNGSLAHFTDLLRGTQPWIQGLATSMGALVRTFLEWGTSAQSIAGFNTILGNTSGLVTAIRLALQPLLTGFLDLAVVGSNWLHSFAPALKDTLTTFGQWMSKVSESGQAMAWLDDAVVVLKQLGGVVKDVWQIFSGLLKAARDAGTGALGVLGQLLDSMNKWVNSAKGQEILVTIFKALQQVGQALVPVITSLMGALATVAPAIAQVAQAVGPVLASAISAVAPALAALAPGIIAVFKNIGQAVEILGPALTVAAGAFSRLLVAVAPVIPLFAQGLVALLPGLTTIMQALGQAVVALSPAWVPLGQAISGVLVAAAPLLPLIANLAAQVITMLAPALPPLAAAFVSILTALGPLIPVLAQIAVIVAQQVTIALQALAPHLPGLVQAFGQLLMALTPLLPPIMQLVISLTPLIPVITDMIRLMANLATAVMPILTTAINANAFATQMLGEVVKFIWGLISGYISFQIDIIKAAINWFSELPSKMGDWLGQVKNKVTEIWDGIRTWISEKIDQVKAKLSETLNAISTGWSDAWNNIKNKAGEIWDNIRSFISEKVEAVRSKLSDVLGQIRDKWNEIWGDIRSFVSDKIDGIRSTISDTLNRIRDTWRETWDNVKNFVVDKWNEIRNGISDRVNGVMDLVRGLPDRIRSALGNLGGLLSGAGRDIIVGLWNGMVGMWDWFRNQILGFFSSIMPDWVRQALGINSPSKLFRDKVGQFIPAGVAEGILGNTGVVQSASRQMADAALVSAVGPMGVAPAAAAAVTAPTSAAPAGGGLHIAQLSLNMQGIVDLRQPSQAARQFLVEVREGLRRLEMEYV